MASPGPDPLIGDPLLRALGEQGKSFENIFFFLQFFLHVCMCVFSVYG